MARWWVLAVLAACGGSAKDKAGGDSGATASTATPTGSATTTGTGASGGGATGGGTSTGSGTATGSTTSTGTGTGTGTATGTGTGTATGSGTGTGGTGTAIGDCALTALPQVVACSVTLPAPGPATLTLAAPGQATRVFASDAIQAEHSFTGWGLAAETTYTWEMADAGGAIDTGRLPADLRGADIDVSGTLFGTDAVLVNMPCGYFAMVDTDGQIIWAIPTTVYDSISDGMFWSQPDRSVLAVRDSLMSRDSSLVVEHHVSGEELLRLEPGDFTMGLSHDIGRWGAYTYLLGEIGPAIGGFEVWEGTDFLGMWTLRDAFPDEPLGDAHVNGLNVSAEGEVLISVHARDGVVAVDGDPASPTFLQMVWHAAGEPGGRDDLPDPDYVPEGPGDLFVHQHNASRHGDMLWLFDNESQPDSRALRMRMDHERGVLVEDGAWSIGRTCLNQGGAIPIDGGVLITCANSGDVYAVREDAASPDWSFHADCGGGGFGFLEGHTRAYPVTVE